MGKNNNLKFSIVIPSYNEMDDVRISIEAALSQQYQNKEIIVVDDSIDGTPGIIKEYVDRGVRLVNGQRKGCCEARNLGITEASGDVIVILHADVSLPKDFLNRIAEHYKKGADWVLVKSHVYNTENLFARFVEMNHLLYSDPRDDVWATEGASFRKEAILAVGGYTGEFSVKFCRDWTLGKKITESAKYKKIIDRSIIVPHKAPDNLKEYWQVRKTRGRFGALLQYYMWSSPLLYLCFKFAAKDIINSLKFLTIIPAFRVTYKLSRFSKNPGKDMFLLMYPFFLQEIARMVGEWEGIKLILKTRKRFGHERVKKDLW